MNARKSITAAIIACILVTGPLASGRALAQQAANNSTPPPVGPPRPFKLPSVQEKTLENGLHIIFIEDHKQPVVSLSLMIKSGATAEPADRAGLASFTAG